MVHRRKPLRDPRVSVVLPYFDAEDTLGAAIDSIRTQSFEDWELILFDDGSSDTSLRIAEDRAARDRRIRILPSTHVGIVAALQKACSEARGDLIARMDADDVAYPERIARQLNVMEEQPGTALCGACIRMIGPGIGYGRRRYERWINELVFHDAIVRELFVECPIPHPTFMITREAFETVGGYQDHGWAEDYDLCFRLFVAGLKFAKAPEVLLDWRESPRRLSMIDERYAPSRFRDLKRHYLFQTYLKDHDVFYQWGAGEVGKRWLREWEGPKPEAVVDINPRKIGRSIHGIPVIAPVDLPRPENAYLLVAVGAPTARQEIRDWLTPRGYRELEHFLFLA